MPNFTSRQGAALLAACLGLTACGDDTPSADATTGVVPATTSTTPATTSAVGSGDGGLGAEGGATAGDGGFDLGSLLGDGGLDSLLDASLPDGATTLDAATSDAGALDDASTPVDDGGTPNPVDASVEAATEPSFDASTDAGPTPSFPPVDDPGENGPFETNGTLGDAEGPNCTIYRPATLGEGGLKHPVILWGMGTGGVNLYPPAFDLWASHGFIVAAGLSAHGQGSGEEMLGCLEYVCEEYAHHVDCTAGAAGHSQGGAGALMAGTDPRVVTTAPVQPYIEDPLGTGGFGGFDAASITAQTGPMLLQSGSLDTVAGPDANQQPIFDDTNVPVFWANAVGVDHISPGVDGLVAYREIMLAWFRLHLMGDESFRDMFYGDTCTVCGDDAFEVQRKGMD